MSRKWCHRCQKEGHLKRDCPRGRLRVMTGPEPEPAPVPEVSDPWDLSHQPRINQQPDLSAVYAYWDTSLPLVSIYEAWDGPESPAAIAREMRLRAEAARQVAESRAAREVL